MEGTASIRIFRSESQQASDVKPLSFGTMLLPIMSDWYGRDLGVRFADFDADGLRDVIDWRATKYVTEGTNLNPVTVGSTFRGTGSSFLLDGSLRPPAFLPFSHCATDSSAAAYEKAHHLQAQPIDLDGDGKIELMGSVNVKWISTKVPKYFMGRVISYQEKGFLRNEYAPFGWVDGAWLEKPEWKLPFYIENIPTFTGNGGPSRDEHFLWTDLNTDGYPDLVVHTTSSGRIYDRVSGNLIAGGNTGVAFINKGKQGPGWIRDDSAKLPEPMMVAQNDVGRRLVDLDGDGIQEIAEAVNNGSSAIRHTYRMNGSGPYRWNSTPGMKNPPPSRYDLPTGLVSGSNDLGVLLLDVNGDGLPDVLRGHKEGSVFSRQTWLNHGSRGQAAWLPEVPPAAAGQETSSYVLPVPLHYVSDAYRILYGFEWGDINGDGMMDVLYSDIDNTFTPGPDNLAILNTGSGWLQRPSWGLPGTHRFFKSAYDRTSGKRHAMLQDLNGDGFPDLITGLLGEVPQVWFNNCRPEVLKSVSDGFGSELGIDYHRLNDPTPTPGFGTRVYEKHSGILPAGHAAIVDARLVVSRYSEPDGMGGRRYRSQRYGDLRYDRHNEASLGFGWIEALDELTGQVSRTETSREFPFAGSPVYSETKVNLTQADIDAMPSVCASGGALAPGVKVLSTETASYAELPSTTGVGGTIRRPVQTGSVKRLFDLDGSLKSETVTTQALADFDVFGFVKSSKVQALDGSLVTTSNTYTHNTSGGKWHLGRLTGSTVTKSGGGKPSITKTSAFTYDASTGLLKTETIEPGNPLSVTTAYTHDAFGNVVGTTVTASGKSRTSQTTYDSKGRFVVGESNQLGHTVTYSYDDSKSLLLSTTDINGKTTSFGYDKFGTQIYTRHPDGTESAEITGYADNRSVPATVAAALTNPIVYFRAKESSGSPVATVYLDAMGRELVAETTILRDANSALHSKVYSVTRYDNQGRKTGVSDPFGANETPLFTTVSYDLLNRTTQTTHPDGTFDRVLVQGACSLNAQPMTYSKVVGRNGQTLERWEDQHGCLVRSSDPSNQITTFNHDHEGRMLSVAIDGVTQLTNTFDLFGNKTQVTEINSGTSSSSYNGFGEAISVTNAKGQTTTTQYDVLGRPASVTKPEGTYAFFYDGAPGAGLGKPWKTTGPDAYLETVAYDNLGRPISTSKRQFGETFTTSSTYDSLGRVATATDAGGLTVVHEYDAFSFPIALRIGPGVQGAGTLLWKAGTFDAKGRALSQTLAQGVTTTAGYHPTSGLLTAMSSVHSTGTLQGKSYVWDANGNLTSRVDMIAQREESFTYDSLNRVTGSTVLALSGAIITTVPPPATYTYAANGNLLSKPGLSNVSYGGPRPHAVTSATVKNSARTFTYDAAGYVIDETFSVASKRRSYTWASFGQLKSLDYLGTPALLTFSGTMIYAASRVQSDFAFDAGGNRARQIKKRIATNDSRKLEETLYLGSYEREIHSTQASAGAPQAIVKTVHRHSLGGFAVYTRTQKPGLPDSVKLSTILKDHLGSTDVILAGTWNGNSFTDYVTEYQSFDPWGERRYANNFNNCRPTYIWPYRTSSMDYDRGYTGHEQLDDSGLIHMNGRIYDPELGRMLSPDPVVQVPEYSQNFNRYSYVMNNPLNMTDPTGFSWLSKAFHKIGHWVKKNWRTLRDIVITMVATAIFGAIPGRAVATAITTGMDGNFSWKTVGRAALAATVDTIGDVLATAALAVPVVGPYLYVGIKAVSGGLSNRIMGGKFQDGFIAAGTYAAVEQFVPHPKTNSQMLETTKAFVIGGTAAELGGGKFANGGVTAAFQYLASEGVRAARQRQSIGLADQAALEYSGLVYETKNGGLLSEFGIDYSRYDRSGFGAALFKVNGHYYLAFRGTTFTSGTDWWANIKQALGFRTAQYNMADELARRVYQQTGGNVTFVGHSLGGGLASAAAYATGGNAVTFNAAGLSWRYRVGTTGPGNITANYIRGDILSVAQDFSILPSAAGNRISFAGSGHPIARHGWEQFLSN